MLTEQQEAAMRITVLSVALALAGCNQYTDASGATHASTAPINKDELPAFDQCLRAQLFQQCLKAIPVGPMATKYNDWDEVVSECRTAARTMSLRVRKNVKEECRAD